VTPKRCIMLVCSVFALKKQAVGSSEHRPEDYAVYSGRHLNSIPFIRHFG
jgi:hypothetical protein